VELECVGFLQDVFAKHLKAIQGDDVPKDAISLATDSFVKLVVAARERTFSAARSKEWRRKKSSCDLGADMGGPGGVEAEAAEAPAAAHVKAEPQNAAIAGPQLARAAAIPAIAQPRVKAEAAAAASPAIAQPRVKAEAAAASPTIAKPQVKAEQQKEAAKPRELEPIAYWNFEKGFAELSIGGKLHQSSEVYPAVQADEGPAWGKQMYPSRCVAAPVLFGGGCGEGRKQGVCRSVMPSRKPPRIS
jgi:hypothetical protein